MSKKKRAEPPTLASVEEVAGERKRVTPLYLYDSKTNAIRLPPSIDDELRALALNGKKVEAVKRVIELTGAGLRVSKDYADRLMKER